MVILKPSAWQAELILSPARIKSACCGRRSGKTKGGLINLQYEFIKNPQLKAWYTATTYGQAKARFWKPLTEGKDALFPKELIKYKSISDLYIELVTGAEIWLKGADNIDSTLGDSLDYLHMDEYQSYKPGVWDLLRPMLADRKGSAYISGTPRGYNFFYDLWWKGCNDNIDKNPNYQSWQVKTIDAGTIDEEEIEDAKSQMSPSMFAQEFEASFENLSNKVFTYFNNKIAPEGNIRTDISLTPINSKEQVLNLPLLVGMDFNVNPMTATINIKYNNELWTIDEIYLENSNTSGMIEHIKNRYSNKSIIVYPDPSGGGRRTSADIGSTDHELLRRAGFRVEVKSKAPYVSDRINEMNAMLLNAKNERRWFIHPRCVHLIKSLSGLVYTPNGDIDKQSGLDHMTDGVGYLIDIEFPIRAIARQYGMNL